MNWLFVATIAQIILGTSAVFDKIFLKRKLFDPLNYTFWLGFLGVFSFVLLPFGFQIISIKLILIGILAGIVFIVSIFFLFYALDLSEASQTIPVIGGISPFFTLIFGYFLLNSWLGSEDLIAFLFLIIGAIILFIVEKKDIRGLSFILILMSALFLGLSNILSKIIFNNANFITGFFWIKVGGIIFVLLFFIFPKLRQRVFYQSAEFKISNYSLYVLNRAYAGFGSLLVSFAISISQHPALVDVIQSFKYIIIFIFAWILLKERFSGLILVGKVFATIFIFCGIFLLGAISYARNIPINYDRNIIWGLTYSTKFSRQLGLDWQKTYESILEELHPSKIRLVAYWDQIEKEQGKFDFSEIDWLLQKSAVSNTKIIFNFGMKVPRWPECHIPSWAKDFDVEIREEILRQYIKIVASRYKDNKTIEMWQLENEPFLNFGECPNRGENFFDRELVLLKSIDSTRPILVTDGGEFGLWYKAVKSGDVFGTTMYRNVYLNSISWLIGNIDYSLSPSYFILKERTIRLLTDDFNKRFIVAEFQAEPWTHLQVQEVSYDEQIRLFSPSYFTDTIIYAKGAGFDEYYLWGAEWWYFMKTKYNNSEYWNYAKNIFRN